MKIIQKLGIIALALFFTINIAQAQRGEGGNPEKRAEKMTAKMTTELGLNAQQTEQVKAINLKYAKGREALKDNRSEENREAARAKMKEMREQQKTELQKVLNAEQLEKMAALKGDRRGKKGGKKEGKGERPTPTERAEKMTAKMTTELGLNVQQAQQVKAINLKYAARQETLAENRSPENREAMHTAKKEMRKDQKAELERVLTPAQLEKMATWKKERGGKKGHRKGHKKDDLKEERS